MAKNDDIAAAADRVVNLESELESAGTALTGDADLAWLRQTLAQWVETVVGVVSSPGVGRVTLIHANGQETRIASASLPFLLLRPARFDRTGDAG